MRSPKETFTGVRIPRAMDEVYTTKTGAFECVTKEWPKQTYSDRPSRSKPTDFNLPTYAKQRGFNVLDHNDVN